VLTVAFQSVSDTEEKARIMRLIQNNGAAYIARRSKLSIEELTKLVRGGKNYVVSGPEAIKVGFATGLID
jgi:pyruvate/2-oxoacid:ferredoxin oxidoreductase beta subunit